MDPDVLKHTYMEYAMNVPDVLGSVVVGSVAGVVAGVVVTVGSVAGVVVPAVDSLGVSDAPQPTAAPRRKGSKKIGRKLIS